MRQVMQRQRLLWRSSLKAWQLTQRQAISTRMQMALLCNLIQSPRHGTIAVLCLPLCCQLKLKHAAWSFACFSIIRPGKRRAPVSVQFDSADVNALPVASPISVSVPSQSAVSAPAAETPGGSDTVTQRPAKFRRADAPTAGGTPGTPSVVKPVRIDRPSAIARPLPPIRPIRPPGTFVHLTLSLR